MSRNSSEPVCISVVVPTLNEEKYLGGCLAALSRDLQGTSHEIIVVDGKSTDKTVQIAARYADRIIKDKTTIGAARQAGLVAARSDIVAFIDADTHPVGKWSDTAIRLLREPGTVLAFGPVMILDSVPFRPLLEALYNLPVHLLSCLGVYNPGGLNMVVDKTAALEAGGFNPDFSVMEDVDLGKRIQKQGRVVYSSDLVVRTSLRRFKTPAGVASYPKGIAMYLMSGSTKGIAHKPVR